MRLVIAEDSLLVREGLSRVLTESGHEVVGLAVRAEQVLPMVARQSPDVVLLDVRLPPTFTDEGLRLAATIAQRHTRVGVLVLSQRLEPAVAGLLLGQERAQIGYLLKDRILEPATLQDALQRLADGGQRPERGPCRAADVERADQHPARRADRTGA